MDFTPNNSYKITYIDKEGNETVRKITFIRNFQYRENTYLEAFCHLRKDHRNFLSSSIISSEILKRKKNHVFFPKYQEKKWLKKSTLKPVTRKKSVFKSSLIVSIIKGILDIAFRPSRGMGRTTSVFGESVHDWYHSQSGRKDKLYKIDS
tara:strand:- start:24 stop:473 length:450 start_codon:yes stop_codon:yes gene_type:complete